MTTPPHEPGPFGPNKDPHGQQAGSGYGQYGGQTTPRQPQYGGQGVFGNSTDQTQWLGGPPPHGGQFAGGPAQWPGSGGGPDGFGGAYGGPPPEPPKKKTGLIVAIVAVAVLVVGGAGVGIYLATRDSDGNTAGGAPTSTESSKSPKTTARTSASTGDETTTTEESEDPGDVVDAQPGECIKVNVASATNADVETVDCAGADAIYRVALREEIDTGTCPSDQYVTYTEEGQLLLCLQLNVRDGDCLEVTDAEDKRADCAATTATHRVVGVFDGVDDENQCPETTTETVTYPEPPLTVCLATPAA